MLVSLALAFSTIDYCRLSSSVKQVPVPPVHSTRPLSSIESSGNILADLFIDSLIHAALTMQKLVMNPSGR